MKHKLIASIFLVFLLTGTLATFNLVPPLMVEGDEGYESLDEVGTYFETTYVSIATDTLVHVMLRASSTMIDFYIENASGASSTQVTFGKLAPLTTYYMYEDSYTRESIFQTDVNGNHVYTQDLTVMHHVLIQLNPSTLVIWQNTKLQSDVTGSVEIAANNIVLDGNGHKITGSWGSGNVVGINVNGKSGVTIHNCTVQGFVSGILLTFCSNCIISHNTVQQCSWSGIDLCASGYNTVNDNIVTQNPRANGVYLWATTSVYNTVKGNTVSKNNVGINAARRDNRIFHNNIINNTLYQALSAVINTFDDGYPSGGNYWSNYGGADNYHGPNQDIPGSDGIGDTPYTINFAVQDHYPLLRQWTPTETSVTVQGQDYPVVITSNAQIDKVTATANTLRFDASGTPGTQGYINVIFPMVNTTKIKVFIDGQKLTPPPFPVITSNGTHYFIYFEFTLSTHTIAIRFAPIILDAIVDIDPDTLNLQSNGNWITAYIQLPEGYNPADIVADTILLNTTIPPILDPKYDFVTNSSEYLVDLNEDGILERMVKFNRTEIESFIYKSVGMQYGDIPLTITGELPDDVIFVGTVTIFAFWTGHQPPAKR